MIREPYLVLLVIGIIFSMVFSTNTNNFINQKVYAHMFTADETSSFLAFADQLQVESKLVQTNLVNNNLSLAQNHANKAASLLTPSVVIEIEEQNQKIADDLTTAVSDLQKISSSSEKQQQMVNQLVSDINSTVVEAVNTRMKQGQADPSNFLEKGIEFLGGLFRGAGEEADDKIDVDETTKPIAFADLVDSVLINYGNAYRVDLDMTNMSNMAMMGGNSSSMAMVDMADKNNSNNSGSMNIGSMDMAMMNMNGKTNRNNSLVDMTDYQSAQALATKAQEIFNNELKSTAPNNSSAFITNLENGLRQLNGSIKNKVSPVDIMTIVHTQIHPSLLEIFNFRYR
jgi:hypothetical protein